MSVVSSVQEDTKSKESGQQEEHSQISQSTREPQKVQKAHLTAYPRDSLAWHDENYLTLVFNSFSLADLQQILVLQKRPDGIPKGWHVGYCARQGCTINVEENMTDSGWCHDHFHPGVAPLPLHRVKRILVNELLIRADSRAKLQEIVKRSNGVFLVRDAIEELLSVVLGPLEKRAKQEPIEELQINGSIPQDVGASTKTTEAAIDAISNISTVCKKSPPKSQPNEHPSSIFSFTFKVKARGRS